MQKNLKTAAFTLVIIILVYSFTLSTKWVSLCAGLAFFLFGMQCLEDGLHAIAGSTIQNILGKVTKSKLKACCFGLISTLILQSTTLVSLLTIAFLTTGLLQLIPSVSIILGANLGATSGIWMLALAGSSLSLSSFAMPMLAIGVIMSFMGEKPKGLGRIIMGIAFIFIGIDEIKNTFGELESSISMDGFHSNGILGAIIFTIIGTILTVLLQSSHATLMLTLAALTGGQLGIHQAYAIAIGSNVGSSISTAFVGSLSSNQAGKKLSLAHVAFNFTSAIIAFSLLYPLSLLIDNLAGILDFADNRLLKLALFHTIFNIIGVAIFYPLTEKLVQRLNILVPDLVEPNILIDSVQNLQRTEAIPNEIHAQYLTTAALDSIESSQAAVFKEINHLRRLSIEVICHAIYYPTHMLTEIKLNDSDFTTIIHDANNASSLYTQYIKPVFSEILQFMGKLDCTMSDEQTETWMRSQLSISNLVEAVKDTKHLQKNLSVNLHASDTVSVKFYYVQLRKQMLLNLREIYDLSKTNYPENAWLEYIEFSNNKWNEFEWNMRKSIFESVKKDLLTPAQTSSLINDLGYVGNIFGSLRNTLVMTHCGDENVDEYNHFVLN